MNKPNVLIIAIDCQYDFVMSDGKLPVPGAEAIIVPGTRFLASLDPTEVAGVLFTFDTHDEETFIGNPENLGDEANGVPGFPIHCENGTPGWENVFNVHLTTPGIPAYFLEKGVFDMWEGESLYTRVTPVNDMSGEQYNSSEARDEFIDRIRRQGIDAVRIFGVASDFCVRWAIAGFLQHGFKVEVVEHLTAGIQRDIVQTVADEFPGQVTILP